MTNSPSVSRIAVADDDPESLELLVDFLRSPTAEIHQAANGSELVDLLATRGPFDLIVTDVDMPCMEGLSVISSARKADILTPVVVVTGLARGDLEQTIAGLGNAMLVRKPVALSSLRRAIVELRGGLP